MSRHSSYTWDPADTPATLGGQMRLVILLSIPAILAQLSSIAMQYIDAAMVGQLGAAASASIGLTASTTWLMGGLCMSMSAGFSVQIAQLIGAGNEVRARQVLRHGFLAAGCFGLIMAAIGCIISPTLPGWLGGEPDVIPDATRYFLIYALALPFVQLRQLSGAMLQCSGDMKTPSILNTMMCGLDVVFNALLIFPTGTIRLAGIPLPGANLGVTGAALGTALSEVVVASLMVWNVLFRSPRLALRRTEGFRLDGSIYRRAAKLALPIAAENSIMCGAQIFSTRIVAPLGTVAVAANSLGVTAESFCYMPGYGIGSAATTLIGQSIGAKRPDLAKRFSRLTLILGVLLMGLGGIAMYFLADWMFALLTTDLAVRKLGATVLRIEAFAEPLYAASIVCAGALRGAGDTLVPSILNLVSMWGVRILLALFLAPRIGLQGVWLAMCIELCVRGVLYLIRLFRGKWLKAAGAE